MVMNFLLFLCIILVSFQDPLISELFHAVHDSFIWICPGGKDALPQFIFEDSCSGVLNKWWLQI